MQPPISDPFLPPVEAENRVFRHSFWKVYRGMLMVFVVFAGLQSWWLFARVPSMPPQFYLSNAFLLIGIVPVTSAFSLMIHPVKIMRSGIQGPPIMGFIEWERMKTARFLWLGVPYTRVALRKHLFALWIPLTLKDPKGFAQTIEEWAPEGNPLRLWVQKRGF